jgi:hypothetical protein
MNPDSPKPGCKVCGGDLARPGKVGRKPIYCEAHRGSNSRARTRKRAASTRASEARDGQAMTRAAQLASMMLVHRDAKVAARSVGLAGDVAELAKLARRHHKDLIAGDRSQLGRRLMASIALANEILLQQIAMGGLHARDLSNIALRLSMIRGAVVGEELATDNITQINVVFDDGRDGDRPKTPSPPSST